jgi:hypothetical protein
MTSHEITVLTLTQKETDLLISILEATHNFVTPTEHELQVSYIISDEEVNFARELNNTLTKD